MKEIKITIKIKIKKKPGRDIGEFIGTCSPLC